MAGSSNSNTTVDEEADIRRRVQEILSKPGSTLPVKSERGTTSPIEQRQEHLSAGDPFAIDLPPEQPTRYPIGATVGGVAGIASTPVTGPGAIALTSLLSGGGEALQQLMEHATGSPYAPKTTGEAATRIGSEMALGSLGEGVGRYGGKALGLLKRAMTPGAMEAARFVKAGMPFNGKPMIPQGSRFQDLFLTPAEATGGKNYIQTLQNVAEGSFGGKGIIEEFKTNRDQFLRETMDNFIRGIGKEMPPNQLGEVIAQEIKGNYQAGRAPARAVYNFLTEQTMPKMKPVYTLKPSGILNKDGSPHMVKVQTGETLDQTTGAWSNIHNLKKSLTQDKMVADTLRGLGAKEGGDDVVSTILSYPDKIPYFVAQKLRSRLQSMADVFSIENKRAPALGIIKNVANQVDQSIEKGLQDFYPDAAELWRYANKTYRGANEDFNNEFLRGILRSTDRKDIPEVVMNSIIQPQKFSDVAKLKKAVSPETWATIQHSVLERMMKLSEKDGVIQPHVLEQKLYGPTGLGAGKMGVLFDSEQRTWINRFIKAAHATMVEADTTGKMAIQLQQTGAATKIGQTLGAGVLGGSFAINAGTMIPGTASMIVLGPPVLAKIMTHPKLSKMFVEAMETRATSPKAGAIVGRLLNALVPRPVESTQTSRGTTPIRPSTQPDEYGGLNLP